MEMAGSNKNYVSEQMYVSRICSHGQVTDLSKGFKLKDEQPFSLFVKPKSATTGVAITVEVRLYKETEASPCPCTLNSWQKLEVVELAASNAELLEKYDIYWGCGSGATLVQE